MRMYVSGSLYLKAVVDREQYRQVCVSTSNERSAESAKSCPSHHASQLCVDIEVESAALHEENNNATSARVSKYLDVCDGAIRASGRSIVGHLAVCIFL